ncbi:hypothetical protein PHLGIDRAFT_229543 [Phlebiopsis gigantea 11061_1 CR5-6]|uniref:Aminoglycoside phosphotransferase domain-containing protein n=1 Tax=Phlebiopsis gigantea (strain 11061_1 CR5-6) TaxID=745531 RepID=A0A0C3S5N5_PHLG1|nr:hypothetical protein PHLGIDRAFT_229543 [Phlebiopsis gigantea 11061_1 CR5-6]
METLTGISQTIPISQNTVQKIFDAFYASDEKAQTQVRKYQKTERRGFSSIVQHKSYDVHLADDTSYILLISSSPDEIVASAPVLCTPLSVYQSLLNLLSENTSIPHPTVLSHSDTRDIIPAEYLILSCPPGTPLSDLRHAGRLSDRQNMLIDLEIGRWMREMHERVQNEWFGPPTAQRAPPVGAPFALPSVFGGGGAEEEPSYSWQETFTALLEELLACAEHAGLAPGVSFADVRLCLGRAIGSFLFDDCEVPSLVSFVGDPGGVLIELSAESAEPRITSLLLPVYALYGDPLLETFFVAGNDGSAAPSQALLEGYGGSPILFARHKTKRVWYDAFLCLSVLVSCGQVSDNEEQQSKIQWSQKRLLECAELLKDAPCY